MPPLDFPLKFRQFANWTNQPNPPKATLRPIGWPETGKGEVLIWPKKLINATPRGNKPRCPTSKHSWSFTVEIRSQIFQILVLWFRPLFHSIDSCLWSRSTQDFLETSVNTIKLHRLTIRILRSPGHWKVAIAKRAIRIEKVKDFKVQHGVKTPQETHKFE